MKTLIVPCAGKSSRFPNMRPKWMLTHPEGMSMLEKNLSAIDFDLFDRVVITITKEHDLDYDAAFFLRQVYPDPKIEILILDNFTNGPAETVYETLNKAKIEGAFMIRDSDSFARIKLDYLGANFLAGINLKKTPGIDRIADKSFIILNEQGNVADIIEKKIVSEVICLGFYGFKSHLEFIEIFKKIKNTIADNQEIYVSHITAYQIGVNREIVHYNEADHYEDWGTFESWKKVMGNYTSYFFDLDGVLLMNCGKYGKKNWDNTFLPIDENISFVKQLAKSGAQIILTTARPEKYRTALENYFKQQDIKIHALIMGLNHSPRILINDFSQTNPFPACNAINLPRNGLIGDYVTSHAK